MRIPIRNDDGYQSHGLRVPADALGHVGEVTAAAATGGRFGGLRAMAVPLDGGVGIAPRRGDLRRRRALARLAPWLAGWRR